jgi:transmembrane sensor
MTEARRLADYVQPTLTEARLSKQWAAIEQRSLRPFGVRYFTNLSVRRDGPLALAVATLCVVLLGTYYGVVRHTHERPVAVAVQRDDAGIGTLKLPEGVSVRLSKNGIIGIRTRTSNEIVLSLTRGEASFEVEHRDGRRVTVTTEAFDIEVVGTLFSVAVSSLHPTLETSVTVQRGTIKVRPTSPQAETWTERLVTTGQTWSPASSNELKRTAPPATESANTDVSPTGTAELTKAKNANDIESPLVQKTAKDWFEEAEHHRLTGKLREAAAAFDALRRNYPADPRAALAAFEIGRIRMDGLGDNVGAITAFNAALKTNPTASFSEDAWARLVRLYARTGQQTACTHARDTYMKRYPKGNYVNAVSLACEQ